MSTFGFGNRQTLPREQSSLEQSMGITFSGKTPESLQPFVGYFVEIFLGGGGVSLTGCYKGMTDDGAIVLCPSVFPQAPACFDKERPSQERYAWKHAPSLYRGDFKGVRPTERQFLEAGALGFDRVANHGRLYDFGGGNSDSTTRDTPSQEQ